MTLRSVSDDSHCVILEVFLDHSSQFLVEDSGVDNKPEVWRQASRRALILVSLQLDGQRSKNCTVHILLDTSKVNSLDTASLLLDNSGSSASSWSGGSLDGRDEGSAGRGVQLACQWGAEGSGECARSHDSGCEWRSMGDAKKDVEAVK